MSAVRRAFIFATLERYAVMALNLAMVPIVARLMGPAEFGISVLGLAALAIADTARDLGVTAYIVQQKELPLSRVQTAFTLLFIFTMVAAAAMFLLAGPIAQFYRMEGLSDYLHVIAAAYLLGPFVSPIHAMQRRDLQFGVIATVTTITTIINFATTIFLAYSGFSYMSFAWATLVSGVVAALLGVYFRPEFRVFRFSLRGSKEMLRFGRYDAFAGSMSVVSDTAPYLIFGRLLDARAVGLYQRAVTVAGLPRKTLLGGVASIVLSTMSIKMRAGQNPKETYLRAIELVTALHWPSLIVLSILSFPIVDILLGKRWEETAPIIQIVTLALMLNYSVTLTYATLLVVGAVRDAAVQYLIFVPISVLVYYLAAQHGLWAVAYSMFFTVSLETAVGTFFLRKHLHIGFRDIATALRTSALVTLGAALGPVCVLIFNGFNFRFGTAQGAFALALAGIGWVASVYIFRHPLGAEILRLRQVATELPILRRLLR